MKICQADHPNIIKLMNSGYNQRAIAKHYGVSPARINQIVKLYPSQIVGLSPIHTNGIEQDAKETHSIGKS